MNYFFGVGGNSIYGVQVRKVKDARKICRKAVELLVLLMHAYILSVTMSPFLKVMQLFLMMTATVLGMLVLLLVTPDLEETMLKVVRHYTTPRYR